MNLRGPGLSLLLCWALSGCAAGPLPAPVSQADAVSDSKAASEAKEHAPQAFAAAEKLLAEAKWLHDQGRDEEAAAAGEEAIAAYSYAFALARAAEAEERLERAKKDKSDAAQEVAELDRLQSEVSSDADAFEMRARVHLDTEQVKDVTELTPERAMARRLAARQLHSEAKLLCIATQLLDPKAKGLTDSQETLAKLAGELSVGSVKTDLYPRAASARAKCLEHLTQARRPAIKKAPESADSDRLLTALTETAKVFAFRDDRGIVVNLGNPLDAEGALTEAATQILEILGGTAKAHPNFPLLIVAHTAKSGQKERSDKMIQMATEGLKQAGAPAISAEAVENTQPVVSHQVRGANEKNERLEVVFVVPGR